MTPYKEALGDSRKEKLPFKRKKAPAEPGLESGSPAPPLVGGKRKEKRSERDRTNDTLWERQPEFNNR